MHERDDKSFRWPKRPASERRLYPRIRVELPLKLGADRAIGAVAMAEDISLGGLRVLAADPLPLQSHTRIRIALALTNQKGLQETHDVEADAKVVRVMSREGGFGMSLEFAQSDHRRERLIGIFMLQTMLFVPDVEFT